MPRPRHEEVQAELEEPQHSEYAPLPDFLERCFYYEGEKLYRCDPIWRRVLEAAFTPNEKRKLPYSTVVLGVSKKTFKSTTAAGIGAWFGCCMSDDDDEILVVANGLKQSEDRAFKIMRRALQRHPLLSSFVAENLKSGIKLRNGAEIKPISTEAGSVAGSCPGLILTDELWAATSDADVDLWTELTPIATENKTNSLRVITSYAGWIEESVVLEGIYKVGMRGEPHPDFSDLVGDDGEPWVRVNEEAGVFMFWADRNFTEFAQTEEYQKYIRQQKETLTSSQFKRIFQNKWVGSDEGIDLEQWDRIVDESLEPPPADRSLRLAVGVDTSTHQDRTAIVSVYKKEGRLCLGPRMVWQPEPDREPFDFNKTVWEFLRGLHESYWIHLALADNWQTYQAALDLQREGIPIQSMSMSSDKNCNLLASELVNAIRFRFLVVYPDSATPHLPSLRQEAAALRIRDSTRGLTLKKDKKRKKIDSMVALALALVAARDLPESGTSPSSGIFIV